MCSLSAVSEMIRNPWRAYGPYFGVPYDPSLFSARLGQNKLQHMRADSPALILRDHIELIELRVSLESIHT